VIVREVEVGASGVGMFFKLASFVYTKQQKGGVHKVTVSEKLSVIHDLSDRLFISLHYNCKFIFRI
jgi:hypothetical protein